MYFNEERCQRHGDKISPPILDLYDLLPESLQHTWTFPFSKLLGGLLISVKIVCFISLTRMFLLWVFEWQGAWVAF